MSKQVLKKVLSCFVAFMMLVSMFPINSSTVTESGFPKDVNDRLYLAIYDGEGFPGEPAIYGLSGYTNFNAAFNKRNYGEFKNNASSELRKEVLKELQKGAGSFGGKVWGVYKTDGLEDYFTADSTIMNADNELKIIKAIKGKDATAQQYEIIWYVIKYQTTDGWHVDGLIKEISLYSINYYGNGNTGGSAPIGTKDIAPGGSYTISENTGKLQRTGYEFLGWSEDPSDIYPQYKAGDTIENIDRNISLYAVWKSNEIESYTATVNILLDDVAMDIEEIFLESSLYVKSDMTSEYIPLVNNETGVYTTTLETGEYTIAYYTNGNYIDLKDYTFTVSEDIETTIRLYSVRYDTDGGELVGTTTHNEFYNSTITVLDSIPIKEGYTFKGWGYDGVIYGPGEIVTDGIDRPIVLTAKWVRTSEIIQPEAATYNTEYYLWNSEQQEYTLHEATRNTGKIGSNVEAIEKEYKDYVLNTQVSDTKLVGEVVMPTVDNEDIRVLTLRLYYDIDMIGNDDIPDRYQVIIRYTVEPNVATLSKVDEILTIYHDNKYAESGKVSIGGTVVDHNDEWKIKQWIDPFTEVLPPSTTLEPHTIEVIGGREYIYTAQLNKVASVIEPTAYAYKLEYYLCMSECTLQEVEMKSGAVGEYVDMVYKNYPDYAYDPMNEDNISRGMITPIEIDDTNISNMLVLRAYYSQDHNGDTIPDKYQKEVTFQIRNGTWSDGTVENQNVYVTLLDVDGKYSISGSGTLTIPMDMEAHEGYKNGSWNVTPPTLVTGTDPITFVYSYSKSNIPVQPSDTVKYTIEHYLQNKDLTYPDIPTEVEIKQESIGNGVQAIPKTYSGYVFDEDISTTSGTIKELIYPDNIVVLRLYYAIYTPTVPNRSRVFVKIEAHKMIEGTTLQGNDFSYTLTPLDHAPGHKQITKNDTEGKIEFERVEFTKSGTYQYKIEEVNDPIEGITYDPSSILVTVEVSRTSSRKLEAVVKYSKGDQESNVFVNQYTPEEIEKVEPPIIEEIDPIPNTSDNMNVGYYLFGLFTSLCVLIYVCKRKYRKSV